MSGFNFADRYRAAGFTPGPDTIRLRQEAFDSLLKEMDVQKSVDAARLYFGLRTDDGTNWFREAFASNDPSFSMLDNAREVAVLAACLLSSQIEAANVPACLAALTTAAVGSRTPPVEAGVVEQARQLLYQAAATGRVAQGLGSFDSCASTDAVADALVQGGDWTKAAALSKQVAKEGLERDVRLMTDLRILRQDVEILWWYIGGWSRLLERPFFDLAEGAAALMAGIDLADLTPGGLGPASVPALLHRVIRAGRTTASRDTLAACVDALSIESLQKMRIPPALKRAADVCPVSYAMARAAEIGSSPAWHSAYRTGSQFDLTATFDPADLALQIFRERKLLELLS